MSSSWKKIKLAKLQEKLGLKIEEKQESAETIVFQRRCPSCKIGKLETVITFDSRGPPNRYSELIKIFME